MTPFNVTFYCVYQADGGHGYKEFLAAVEEVKSLPAALCSEKEVWAKYNIDSDTISVFRKVDMCFSHYCLCSMMWPWIRACFILYFLVYNKIVYNISCYLFTTLLLIINLFTFNITLHYSISACLWTRVIYTVVSITMYQM